MTDVHGTPTIDDLHGFIGEFISDLTTFANGSYLKDEEKQDWDQPFDTDAIAEVERTLTGLVDAAEELTSPVAAPTVSKLIGAAIDELGRINAVFGDAVIEPEEEQELADFFTSLARHLGLSDSECANLPTFEQSDPYDEDDITIESL
ncbi:hypothetical protein [Corynebacterium aquilae]|uniref:hypothetical protein n=1 Tax=Corynebacterium aquilae TaxID=203263 RepID=UPI000951A6DF|nr:hypothetical protein [Corynebacterium aquilae]